LKSLFCCIVFYVLFAGAQAFAGPAAPDTFTLDQPDGTSFKAKIHGDEFQNWIEAVDTGHSVIKNRQSNNWEYAEKNVDGTLRASGVRVSPDGKHVPEYIQKGVKPDRDIERENQHHQMLRGVHNRRISAVSSSTGIDENITASGPDLAVSPGDVALAPLSGTKKVLIVLVNFSNRSLVTTAANWYNTIFSTTAGVKSVANYYSDNSFGTLSISPVTHTQPGNPQGVVTVTIADAHPNCGGNFNYSTESAILNHALAQAATYVNFAAFDTNGNGTLEQSELDIYLVYAGYEASGSGNTPNIWAHAWGGGGVTAGGKNVTSWALNGELNNSSAQHPIGVIAHELGHSLCGLPDLYDTSYTNAGLGHFSLMAGGSWGSDTGEYSGTTPVVLDAWSRAYLGWTVPVVPAGSGSISLGSSLASANNVIKLINTSVSTTEYWLAENRYSTTGWDRGLHGLIGGTTGGLLITHIDTAASINRYVTGGHQGVMAEMANNGAGCNMTTSTCRGSASTLFYSGNNSAFGLVTTPNTSYYGGASSDLALSNISTSGTTMTLDFTSGATVGYVTDGKPDILWRNPTTASPVIWFMDGATLLGTATLPSLSSGWMVAAVADFNGDGKPDILWRNPASVSPVIWFMNGATRLSSATLPSLSSGWTVAGVADFDGDGTPDILWRNPATASPVIWFMNSNGTQKGSAILPSLSSGWIVAGVADFDGDGTPDILWRNPVTASPVIWFMNSNGTQKGSAILPSLSSGWTVAGVKDFDGDGVPDILWRNPTTASPVIWFMNSNGTQKGSAILSSLSSGWVVAGVADFDGDGTPDILWRNPVTASPVIWFMKSDGTQKSSAVLPSLSSGWSVAGIM
jgi:M6 family metalloprotease-like protein